MDAGEDDGWDALFTPRSVAVVGASADPTSISRRTLDALRHFGFGGPLWAVNPSAPAIDGVPCFPTLTEVPEPVDLALVFTGATRTLATVENAVAAGVRAAVICSAGFAELGGEGRSLQEQMRSVARAGGLRLLGPNCQGLVHLPHRLVATFTLAVAADHLPPAAPLAYVGQSGALGGSVFDLLRERGATPSVWVSTGNQVDITVSDVARRLVDDPAVELLLLYLEQTPRGDQWEEVCAGAAQAGKSIVVLRGGATPDGRRAMASHTGALAGDARGLELVSARHGVREVRDIDEMVDLALAWRTGAGRSGSGLGILSTSGGAGGLAADTAARFGVPLAELTGGTADALRDRLPRFASVVNPVDITLPSGTPALVAGPEGFATLCRIMADDPGVDQLLVILTMVFGNAGVQLSNGIADFAAGSSVPVHVVYLASHDRSGPFRAVLHHAGVAVYDGVGRAIRAIAALSGSDGDAGRGLAGTVATGTTAVAAPAAEDADEAGVLVVTEAEALPLLARAGVRVPGGALARSRQDAARVAAGIGSAVVMKVQSPDIAHKTEHGAVRIGVAPEDAATAHDELCREVARNLPAARIDGVLVQAMVPGGTELLVGVTGPRDGYPPVVTVGMGGVEVELSGDVVSALAPLDRAAALGLLRQLRGWPLLLGYRGRPGADVTAAAAAVAAISRLAADLGGRLIELEVNPLIVHGAGDGVTAVDFLARLTPEGQ